MTSSDNTDPKARAKLLDALRRGDLAAAAELVRVRPELREAVIELVPVPLRELVIGSERFGDQALRLLLDYRLIKGLGVGGFGEVWKAEHRFLERTVAIKLLKTGLGSDVEHLARFLAEAQIAGRLEHPGIVPVHEVGLLQTADRTTPVLRAAIVMKFVEGRTLQDRLKARPSLATDRGRCIDYFLQIAQAVGYAHTVHGLLHRDLKSANVMIGPHEEVLVMDWGLGKLQGGGAAGTDAGVTPARTVWSDVGETSPAQGMGTPTHMPPEQAVGRGDLISPRSDVFGLGAILAEILTGSPPYWVLQSNGQPDREKIYQQAVAGDVAPCLARLRASGAPAELIEIATACLQRRPQDRPAHGGVVAERIAAYQHGLQEALRKEQERRATLRWRATAGLAGITLAALVALGGTWAVFDQRARAARVAALDRDAAQDLDQVEQALAARRWDEARATWQGVDKLLSAGASATHRPRADALDEALRFVEKQNEIRGRQTMLADGQTLDVETLVGRYAALFQEFGFKVDDLAALAAQTERITASPVRYEILAALDQLVLFEELAGVPGRTIEPHLQLAAGASDPGSWSARVRDPALRRDKARLTELLKDRIPVGGLRASEIESLARLQQGLGLDPERLLRRGLEEFPQDYALHLALAQRLELQATRAAQPNQPALLAEALGHAQAALAVRPQDGLVQVLIGRLLSSLGRGEEAEAAFRLAKRRDPEQVLANYGLALIRFVEKRYPEAENQCREALARIRARGLTTFQGRNHAAYHDLQRLFDELLARIQERRDQPSR